MMLFAFTQCGGAKGSKEFKESKKAISEMSNAIKNAKTCEELRDVWDDNRLEEKEYSEDEQMTEEEKEMIRLEKELIEACIKGRKRKNITQVELSEMTGIPQPTIARIEAQTNSPKVDTHMKYLYALGYSLTVVPIKK